MPELPVHNSKANITANTAEPLRNEAAIPFQQDQSVLKSLGDVAQKWSDANDVMQYTEAKAKHSIAVADVEARATADPDFKNSDKYHKELADIQKGSVAGISNQQLATRAGIEFNSDAQVAAIKIDTGFKHKQIAYNQVMVKSSVDSLMQNKLSASTPTEAQQYDMKIQTLLQANVETGTLSYAEADKLLKDSQETSVKYEVYADNATQEKDSTLLKELKDPKGRFDFLDPDTRLKMIEEDQRRIFQNNQTFKKENELSRDQKFNDVFTKANEGTLTLNDLDAQMAIPEEAGGIPKKQLLDIRKSLQSRIKTDLETVVENNDKAGDYVKFVDNFISDETDRQKGREAIVNAFKDNILSPKEAAFLNSLKRETEDIQWSKQKEGMSSNNLIPFKNTINGVIDWFRGSGRHNEKDAAIAIKKLLSGVADGNPIDEVTQQVLKEDRVNTKPDIKTFPKNGQKMVDPVTGVTAIVYPDGTIEVENGGVRRNKGDSNK